MLVDVRQVFELALEDRHFRLRLAYVLNLHAVRREGDGAEAALFQHRAQPAHPAANVERGAGAVVRVLEEQLGVAPLRAVDVGDGDVLRLAGGIIEIAVVEEAGRKDLREERELRVVVRALSLLAVALEGGRAEEVTGMNQSACDRLGYRVRLEFSQANTPLV